MLTTTADQVAVGPDVPVDHVAGQERRDFLWIVLGGLLLFGLSVNLQLHGDPAMYADYIVQSKWNELTLHIGYYAVAWVFQHTLGALLGLPIEETLAWLNVVAGALALGFFYLLGRHFLGNRRDALLCVLILALCGRVIENATISEIYMLQTMVVAASYVLFIREQVVAAGLLAGAALLVSPLSAFAYLFFPVYDYQRAGRVRWGVWLKLTAGAVVVYLPYLVVDWRELLWGHRGLLSVQLPLQPVNMLREYVVYLVKHYTVLLGLLLPAIWVIRRERRFLWLTLSVVVPHFYIAMRIPLEDNVFLLNTDIFIACWLVLGWRELARLKWGRAFGAALLVVHGALMVADGQLLRFRAHREFAAEMRHIARQYLVGRNATMISDWDTIIVLTFFGRPAVVSTIERDPLWHQMFDIMVPEIQKPALLDAPELYLLEGWHPGPLKKLIASPAAIERARRENSDSARASWIGLQCTLVERTTYPLYRCVRSRRPAPAPGATP